MYGLSERSYNELMAILASVPEVEEAVLYGSRARGDNSFGSDIDLSLHGSQLNSHILAVLNDKLYESHIPFFFDTHIYSKIKDTRFKANVDRDGIVIYRRK